MLELEIFDIEFFPGGGSLMGVLRNVGEGKGLLEAGTLVDQNVGLLAGEVDGLI